LSTSDSKRYILSALLDADSFFYALIDPLDHRVNEQGKLQLSSGHDLLSVDSIERQNSKIAIWTDHMTIVPKDDFEPSQINIYLDQDSPSASSTLTYMSDYMEGIEAYICYAVKASALRRVSAYSPMTNVCHLIKSLTQSLAKTYGSIIQLLKIDQKTLLLAIQDGKLVAFHLSVDSSPVSVLYNVCLVSEKHTQMKDAIVGLSGDYSESDKTKNLLTKYYRTEILGANYHLESIYRCES